MERFKELLWTIIVFLVFFAFIGLFGNNRDAVNEAYNEGYEAGYEEGYALGLEHGVEAFFDSLSD